MIAVLIKAQKHSFFMRTAIMLTVVIVRTAILIMTHIHGIFVRTVIMVAVLIVRTVRVLPGWRRFIAV